MKPLDDEGRRLIADVSAADRPAAGADSRIWEALASRLDAPLSPVAEAAKSALETQVAGAVAAQAAQATLGAKLLLSIVASSVLVAGGAVWYTTRALPPAEPRARIEAPAAVRPDVTQAAPAVLAQPTATDPPATSAAPADDATSSSARAASSRRASNLLAETELLAAAQRALNGGSPARALELLDRHRTRFHRGALAPERDAARVLALCALGREAQAERERQRFVRNWPDSPLRERIHAGCK